jgi:hypothetical protein
MNITEFAHLNAEPTAMLPLLRAVADAYLGVGGRRVVIQTGGQAPVLSLLAEQNVPLELEVGPGLMVLVVSQRWLKDAGFRTVNEAIGHLFFAQVPVMWHRDGY